MTDPPCLWQITPAQQSYKHSTKGDDRRGGGAVVHCKYLLSCYDVTYEKFTEFIVNLPNRCAYLISRFLKPSL